MTIKTYLSLVLFIFILSVSGHSQCISGNCQNGSGTYKYENGQYTGSFVNGKRNGDGTYVYTNGNKFVGKYEEGERVYGTFYYSSGSRYTGQFLNDERHGVGKAVTPEGKILNGYWEYGKFKGDNPVTTYAVIAGVNDYAEINDLSNCVNDANDFYDLLSQHGVPSSNMKLLTDGSANKSAIIGAMDIFKRADSNDKIFFFFSGHGGEGGFCPSDFSGYYSFLFYDEVKAAFKSSNAAYKMCIADACFSGGILDKEKAISSGSAVNNRFDDDTQIAVFMSSRSDQTSSDGGGVAGNGLFTGYLINGMEGSADYNSDDFVTITELYVYVREKMTSVDSGQVPVLKGKFNKNLVVFEVK